MWLIVDQLLVAGFIPINTRQQRDSLSFKPGVLERKVYNNDDIGISSVSTFAKPECANVLQPEVLMFYPLNAVPWASKEGGL